MVEVGVIVHYIAKYKIAEKYDDGYSSWMIDMLPWR
jgi:hypothetical protein